MKELTDEKHILDEVEVSYTETDIMEDKEVEITIEDIQRDKKYYKFGIVSASIGILLTGAIVGIAIRFILLSKKILGSEFTDLKLFSGITGIFGLLCLAMIVLTVKYFIEYKNVTKQENEFLSNLVAVSDNVSTKTEIETDNKNE